MAAASRAAIPPASRKTLLEWIDIDDGNTNSTTRPVCNAGVQTLHAQILVALGHETRGQPEPLDPPPGLRLAPLG